MKTQIETTPFRRELAQSIRKYIRGSIADGTTSMSVDCLKQCVRSPSRALAGAPCGTNAQWAYAQIFREVCQERDIAAFTSESERGA